jgi:hypothetical protein
MYQKPAEHISLFENKKLLREISNSPKPLRWFLSHQVENILSSHGTDDLVQRSRIPGLVTPAYEGNCISNLPDTFAKLVGVKQRASALNDSRFNDFVSGSNFENVIFLLLDGFGFHSIERARERGIPSIERLEQNSLVTPLTSVFPSTTSTATTSLHTGLTPQEHGILGYTTYMREIGSIVQMLDFCPVYSRRSIFELGFDPAEIIGQKTIHERLSDSGVQSNLYISRYIVGSGLSQITNRGAEIYPILSASDLLTGVRQNLARGPGFHFAYYASPDTIAHARGPFSEEYAAEVDALFYTIHRELIEKMDQNVAKKTLLMISADHGLAQIDQRNIIDLARHGELLQKLKVPPTGDSRCLILHAKTEKEISEISDYFDKKFPSQFKMLLSKDALSQGLFGLGSVKEQVPDRLGDLIAIPKTPIALDNSNVQHRDDYVPGRHGGLSYEEMVVPLITTRLA